VIFCSDEPRIFIPCYLFWFENCAPDNNLGGRNGLNLAASIRKQIKLDNTQQTNLIPTKLF
jgi:hypothetical protein